MNITVFNGSPRVEQGNTHIMVEAFSEGAQKAGAHIEPIFLQKKEINHCRGCFACWGESNVCVLDDDMTDLIGKYMGSDVVIFATPVYVDNVTGIMKQFMDRLPLIWTQKKAGEMLITKQNIIKLERNLENLRREDRNTEHGKRKKIEKFEIDIGWIL